MAKFHWFQLLKCEHLFIVVLYDSKLNIFGHWIFGLREFVMDIFHSLLTKDKMIKGVKAEDHRTEKRVDVAWKVVLYLSSIIMHQLMQIQTKPNYMHETQLIHLKSLAQQILYVGNIPFSAVVRSSWSYQTDLHSTNRYFLNFISHKLFFNQM